MIWLGCAALAGACGDDGGGDGSTGDDTTSTTAPATDGSSSTAPSTSNTSASTTESSSSSDGSSSSSEGGSESTGSSGGSTGSGDTSSSSGDPSSSSSTAADTAGETGVDVCGGCEGGEYCVLPVGECDSKEGECQPIPNMACPEIYAPVCGCDGATYSNDCEAENAGMNIDYEGEC